MKYRLSGDAPMRDATRKACTGPASASAVRRLHPPRRMAVHRWRWLTGLALCAAITACGGGGDDAPDLPCGGGQTLSIAVAYEVNGTLLDVASTITLPRDVYLTATPRVVGLPAACAGKAHVSVGSGTTTSPGGVTLDRSTGVISGTATTRAIFDLQLKITVDGYPLPVYQDINVFI